MWQKLLKDYPLVMPDHQAVGLEVSLNIGRGACIAGTYSHELRVGWATAQKEFKRSIELKPKYATAHQWYAIHYLTAASPLDEAIEE